MIDGGPDAAVLAVVTRDERVLLVRRANPPDAGLWGFPGGKIEPGETIEQAALRELREECGLAAEAGSVLTALDAIAWGGDGRLGSHFVLIAVLCRGVSGEAVAGDDALEVGWFAPDRLEEPSLAVSRDVAALARQALATSGAQDFPARRLPTD
ncbi:MAG: NUDIX hydrolase [Rhodospirillales bacterium]